MLHATDVEARAQLWKALGLRAEMRPAMPEAWPARKDGKSMSEHLWRDALAQLIFRCQDPDEAAVACRVAVEAAAMERAEASQRCAKLEEACAHLKAECTTRAFQVDGLLRDRSRLEMQAACREERAVLADCNASRTCDGAPTNVSTTTPPSHAGRCGRQGDTWLGEADMMTVRAPGTLLHCQQQERAAEAMAACVEAGAHTRAREAEMSATADALKARLWAETTEAQARALVAEAHASAQVAESRAVQQVAEIDAEVDAAVQRAHTRAQAAEVAASGRIRRAFAAAEAAEKAAADAAERDQSCRTADSCDAARSLATLIGRVPASFARRLLNAESWLRSGLASSRGCHAEVPSTEQQQGKLSSAAAVAANALQEAREVHTRIENDFANHPALAPTQGSIAEDLSCEVRRHIDATPVAPSRFQTIPSPRSTSSNILSSTSPPAPARPPPPQLSMGSSHARKAPSTSAAALVATWAALLAVALDAVLHAWEAAAVGVAASSSQAEAESSAATTLARPLTPSPLPRSPGLSLPEPLSAPCLPDPAAFPSGSASITSLCTAAACAVSQPPAASCAPEMRSPPHTAREDDGKEHGSSDLEASASLHEAALLSLHDLRRELIDCLAREAGPNNDQFAVELPESSELSLSVGEVQRAAALDRERLQEEQRTRVLQFELQRRRELKRSASAGPSTRAAMLPPRSPSHPTGVGDRGRTTLRSGQGQCPVRATSAIAVAPTAAATVPVCATPPYAVHLEIQRKQATKSAPVAVKAAPLPTSFQAAVQRWQHGSQSLNVQDVSASSSIVEHPTQARASTPQRGASKPASPVRALHTFAGRESRCPSSPMRRASPFGRSAVGSRGGAQRKTFAAP